MVERVYVAASWKERERVRAMSAALRAAGHDVFDFTDKPAGSEPEIPPERFPEQFDPARHVYREYLTAPPEWRRAVEDNRRALEWCSIVVMLLPCGNDAHADAYYAFGLGRPLVIAGQSRAGERTPTHLWADALLDADDEVVLYLSSNGFDASQARRAARVVAGTSRSRALSSIDPNLVARDFGLVEDTPFPYPVLVAWSDEDECYVARVPPFFGLAAHGDTLLAAVAEAQRAAGAMVDVLGEQAPKPATSVPCTGERERSEREERGARTSTDDPDAFDPPTIIYRCSRCGVAERSGERPSITSGKLRVYPLPVGWELVPCPFLEEDDHLRCAVCVGETGGTTMPAGEGQATLQAARDAAGVLRAERDAARGELAKLLNHVEKRNTTHACSGEWETCWCDTCEARRTPR